jgi:hypothetical protein
MGDTAEIAPDAFAACGVEDDFAGPRRHVKHGAAPVIERDAIERAMLVEAGRQRPLVVRNGLHRAAIRDADVAAAHLVLRDRQRQLLGADRSVGKIGGANGCRGRRPRHDVERPIASLHQADPRRAFDTARFDRLRRPMLYACEIERRQTGEAFRFSQHRKRHEMHHDAAREPHREQQTKRDAERTMKQDESARHCRIVFTT